MSRSAQLQIAIASLALSISLFCSITLAVNVGQPGEYVVTIYGFPLGWHYAGLSSGSRVVILSALCVDALVYLLLCTLLCYWFIKQHVLKPAVVWAGVLLLCVAAAALGFVSVAVLSLDPWLVWQNELAMPVVPGTYRLHIGAQQ
jgi:hypothetical protein